LELPALVLYITVFRRSTMKVLIGKTMICMTNCTLTTARIDAKSKFNTIFFRNCIDNSEIYKIIVVWCITNMNNYEFLQAYRASRPYT